jgi:hypothetical protein
VKAANKKLPILEFHGKINEMTEAFLVYFSKVFDNFALTVQHS